MPASTPITRVLGRFGLRPPWASSAFLAAGVVALGIYFALPGLGLPQSAQEIAYEVIGVAAVLALYIGIRLSAEEGREPWYLLCAGVAFEVGGDIVSTYYEVHLGYEAPVPSLADVFYILGYPFFAIGILRLLKELGAELSRATVLDAVILFVAVATIQWIFVVGAYVHESLGTGERIVDIAYPSMDVFLFVAIAQLLIGPRERAAPYRLLIVAVALMITADEVFFLTQNYETGRLIDVFFLGSYIAFGAAGLRRPRTAGSPRDRRSVPRLSRTRMAVLSVALVSVPAGLLLEHFTPHRTPHTPAAAIGTTLIAVLVLFRLSGLLRAVEAQNVQLRKLDRLKDEFVSSVSHELRTPLTSISGYLELLGEDENQSMSGRERSYLTIVARNTRRLLKVVNDLLFFSGMQDGHLSLRIEPVDLSRLATDAAEIAQPAAATKRVKLTCVSDAPVWVAGEPERLAQMLDNLVSNAVKFTPADGWVTIRTSLEQETGTIEVADSGIGIPLDEQDLLFERFFRSSNAVEGAVPGTGLGLYISKAIAEAHDGRIEVESAEGKGTLFRVTLPISGPRVADEAVAPTDPVRRPAVPRT